MKGRKEMIFPFGILTAGIFTLGVLFSLFVNRNEEEFPFYKRAPFLLGLGFLFLYFLAHLPFYFKIPQWMVLYYTSSPIQIEGFFYLFFLFYFFPFTAGFSLGLEFRKRSFLPIFLLLGTSCLLQLGVLLFYRKRLLTFFEHPQWGWLLTYSLGVFLLLSALFCLLAWHFWRDRWLHIRLPQVAAHTLYPSQLEVIQNLVPHFFPHRSNLSSKELAKRLSEYISSAPWRNQVFLSAAIELIQFSPFLFLKKAKLFTSLSKEEQEQVLKRWESTSIASLHHVILILKTLLHLIYYEWDSVGFSRLEKEQASHDPGR